MDFGSTLAMRFMEPDNCNQYAELRPLQVPDFVSVQSVSYWRGGKILEIWDKDKPW